MSGLELEASGPPEAETGTRLTIDRDAIAANWRTLARRSGPAECAAVVKADAYGLGLRPVAEALAAAGARTFFVAHLAEARTLRTALPDAVVYVLNGVPPGTASAFAALGVRPVLGTAAEIAEWGAVGGGAAAIHVDTGMNRLGLSLDDARASAAAYESGRLGFAPSLVMSHLACADTPGHPLNARQRSAFAAIRGLFPTVPASLANSAATLTGIDLYDLCRPGIALYGGNPFTGGTNPMRAAVRFEARIVQVRTAPAGTTIGYGAAETARRPLRLAILSLGYADGLMRAAGSRDGRPGGAVAIAGCRCPLVGRISMDLAAADISAVPEAAVRHGDWATVIGEGISLDEVAETAGTVSYEVLTGLGRRAHRVYV